MTGDAGAISGFGLRISGFGIWGTILDGKEWDQACFWFRGYWGLRRNVKRFRGGLVFQAHRLVYHSTLGLKVIKKKKKDVSFAFFILDKTGTGFGVSGCGIRVSGFGIRDPGSGFRDPGSRFQVPGFGVRDQRQQCEFGGRTHHKTAQDWDLDPQTFPTLRVSGFWFLVSVFGFRVSCVVFRVPSFGFRVSGSEFRVPGFEFRVYGFGFRVSGFGIRDSGFGFRASGLEFGYRGFGLRGSHPEQDRHRRGGFPIRCLRRCCVLTHLVY